MRREGVEQGLTDALETGSDHRASAKVANPLRFSSSKWSGCIEMLWRDYCLTVFQCAHYLHCGVNTLRRLVQAGEFSYLKIGRSLGAGAGARRS